MLVRVDIMEIRAGVKAGYFKTKVVNGKILLEDTVSGECVRIGTVPAEDEDDGKPV